MPERERPGHLSERADRLVTFGLTGLFIAALLAMLLLPSCQHEPLVMPEDLTGGPGGGPGPIPEEPVDTCDPNTVYFAQQVLPLLISNCAIPGCHDAGTHEEGIIMDSWQHIMDADIVRPYDLDRDLYEAITENDPDDIMPPPPHAPLTGQQIGLIRDWILQGAQNNSCESGGCDTTNVTYAGTIRPIVQNKCQGCHSGADAQGGHDFTTYADLHAVALSGHLAGAIQHQAPYASMPSTGSPLPSCQIRQILIWIADGAPNN